MADETIEGSATTIADKLRHADVPKEVVDRLLRKAATTRKHAQQWVCHRHRIACETSNQQGWEVNCTVTYDDGSSEETTETWGCD